MVYICTLRSYDIHHLSWCPRNELKKQEMAEALHREVEELKGVLDAGFAFMEASKVCVCVDGCVGVGVGMGVWV